MWAERRGFIVTPLSPSSGLIDNICVLVRFAVAIFVRLLVRAFSDSLERALASERTLEHPNRELEARTARLQAQEAERERLNGAPVQAAAEWQRTFDAVDTCCVVLARDGRITRINRAARNLLGMDYSEVLGRRIEDLAPRPLWETGAGWWRPPAGPVLVTARKRTPRRGRLSSGSQGTDGRLRPSVTGGDRVSPT